jgi:hypothetical protein
MRNSLIEQLRKDLELVESATPGPYHVHSFWNHEDGKEVTIESDEGIIAAVECYHDGQDVANAKLFASSRHRWPGTIRALMLAITFLVYHARRGDRKAARIMSSVAKCLKGDK